MFNFYGRVLEHVPRWSVVPVLQRQYVASHSFYVALYTAELIESFHPEWTPKNKYDAVRHALIHDFAEARTGDAPGPVKRQTADREKLAALEYNILNDAGYDTWITKHAVPLIKVADLVDELMFATAEAQLGNKWFTQVLPRIEDRLKAAVEKANLPVAVYHFAWHEARRMHNFESPSEDSDVQP